MPLYEYRCETCGRVFEKLRRMQDADAPIACPHCDSEQVDRRFSTFASSSSSSGGCSPAAGRRFT